MSTAADSNQEPVAGDPAKTDAPPPGGQVLPFQRTYPDTPQCATEIVLSRIICRDTRADSVGDIYQVLQAGRGGGATPVPGASDCCAAPPPPGGGPQSVLGSFGLTRQELIAEYWSPAYRVDRQYARLPAAVLDQIFWPAARAGMELFIADGPVTAAGRLTAMLEDYRDTGVCQSTLDNRRSAANKILRHLHECAKEDACPETLRAWRQEPPTIRRVRGRVSDRRTESAELRAVRRQLAEQDAEHRARLGQRPGETEADAVERVTAKELRLRGVWRVSRALALTMLICIVGIRVGAIAKMRRSHLLPSHQYGDGIVGPAIVVPPIKGNDHRVKPIPEELYQRLALLCRITERICAEEGRTISEDSALFPGYLTHPDKLPWPSSLSRFMRGSGDGKQKAHMTRSDGSGVTCHNLRHTNAQLIKRGAAALPRDHEDAHAFAHLHDITQDHKVDKLGYLDVSKPHQIERLSALGIRLAWELIATDKGARRGRDVERYRLHLAIHSRLVQDRRTFLSAQTGPESGSQRLEREEFEAAIAVVAEELRRLREDDDALIPVDDEIDDADIVLDLRAVEEDLRSRLILDGPLLRDWLTVTELCELCGVSRRHLGACWRQGRPLGTADGRQPFGDGPVVLDDSIGQGERRRRIAVADLDPAFLRDPVRAAKVAILLRQLPKGWSKEACAQPLHPRPRTPEELDFS